METQVPVFIKECVTEAGARLGRALDVLEWPSDGKDAPPSELNALINFQCCLMRLDPTFNFYSEGTIASRGRIDMIASNGTVSLALEAKRLGNLNQSALSALGDLDRLRNFIPAYCPPTTGHQTNAWWEASVSRWGLLLVTSFHGDFVRDAWEAADPASAEQAMRAGKFQKTDGFMALFESADLQRFSAPITMSERWNESTAKGHILCGAIELKALAPTKQRAQLESA